MKTLKKIIGGILAIIAIALIAALFISRDFNYEKSILINAPIEDVWEHTSSLKGLERWSPWNDYDPNAKKEFSGVDGTIGAMVSWESTHENVGTGSQTIAKIVPPSLFETDLKFMLPYESEAKGIVKLQTEGSKTKATWGFKSEIPYPFNLMMVMMDMEGSLGKDFDSGLSKLKNLSEKQ